MKADAPFVSPYLLRPLRSYAQALLDRAELAAASPRDSLGDADLPPSRKGKRTQDAEKNRRKS